MRQDSGEGGGFDESPRTGSLAGQMKKEWSSAHSLQQSSKGPKSSQRNSRTERHRNRTDSVGERRSNSQYSIPAFEKSASPTHYSDQETDGRMVNETQSHMVHSQQPVIHNGRMHSDGRLQMSGHESDGIYEKSVTDLQQQLEMMHVGVSNSLPQVPVDSHGRHVHQTPQNAVSEASAKGKLVTFRNFPSEYFSISMPEQGLGNMQYVPAQTGSSNETMLSEAETRSASQSTQDTLPYRANESLGSVSVCSERVVQQNYNPNRTASNESTTLYTRQGGQGDYACSKSSSSSSSWNSFRSVAQEPYNPSRIESSDSVFSGYSAQCVAGYAADAKGSHSDQRQKVSTSNNALTADSGSDDEGFDYRGSSCSSTEAGSKDINVLNTVDGNVRTATVDLDQHAPA
nr:hypothetical protein BaRGS_007198 [Batillaria attramentaria]